MESKKEKVEKIQVAIQQLMEEQQRDKKLISSSDDTNFVDGDGDDHHVILSRLLSQLEALKGDDGKLQQPEPPANREALCSPAVGTAESGGAIDEDEKEEIIRELRKVKRQNFITHCLLSAMIIVTVAWKVSQVSLLLKLKDGFSHPFKSFGSMVTGMLKGPITKIQNGEKRSPKNQEQIEGPSLNIPELPRLGLPLISDSSDEG